MLLDMVFLESFVDVVRGIPVYYAKSLATLIGQGIRVILGIQITIGYSSVSSHTRLNRLLQLTL